MGPYKERDEKTTLFRKGLISVRDGKDKSGVLHRENRADEAIALGVNRK